MVEEFKISYAFFLFFFWLNEILLMQFLRRKAFFPPKKKGKTVCTPKMVGSFPVCVNDIFSYRIGKSCRTQRAPKSPSSLLKEIN